MLHQNIPNNTITLSDYTVLMEVLTSRKEGQNTIDQLQIRLEVTKITD